MKTLFENHCFHTEAAPQFIDVTDDLLGVVERSEVRNGMALVYSPHTTCSIVINERESGFIEDFSELVSTMVPDDAAYRHDDLSRRTDNLEDPHEVPNGQAHCRHALLGSSSEAIPIVDGRLLLGRWQRVFFIELDRPRERRVLLQVMGE